MPKSTSLSLAMPNPIPILSSPARSLASSDTLHSDSPISPHRHEDLVSEDESRNGNTLISRANNGNAAAAYDGDDTTNGLPTSPTFTSLPQFPSSPKAIPKHSRDASKSFFSNLKASKSSVKIQPPEATIRQVPADLHNNVRPKGNLLYKMASNSSSTPDLGSFNAESPSNSDMNDGRSKTEYDIICPSVGTPAMSDSTLARDSSSSLASKRSRSNFASFLTRSPSLRVADSGWKSKPTTPIRSKGSLLDYDSASTEDCVPLEGLRTAPLHHEKGYSFSEMITSAPRNRSADPHPERYPSPLSDRGETHDQHYNRSRDRSQVNKVDSAGGHLLSGLRNTTSRAAGGFGKAGNRIMGKMTRSAGHNGKEGGIRERGDDQPYMCSILILPLREQTRRTRIAKRLEDSKDKTEFWMPSLPWRCIDYLNFRGCDEEGLYRVPGSGQQVKEWQRRFDQELDINLFEEPELYDINIIGSMFKAWLRELPDEIFPKETQERISKACEGTESAPQMLKDELSMLPPWNYYLLFAITCHLSLLHAYVEKNKMTFYNLVICFAPCLKLSADCFRWLVCDWRNCWQGCWTEKAALEEEYRILDGPSSRGADSSGGSTAVENRSLSSSGSSKQAQKPPPLTLTTPSQESVSNSDNRPKNHHGRNISQLPELALAPPLSPIGL